MSHPEKMFASQPQMISKYQTNSSDIKIKDGCECHEIMTTRLAEVHTPGLDVWVDGVSKGKTLELLRYLPDNEEEEMNMAEKNPIFRFTTNNNKLETTRSLSEKNNSSAKASNTITTPRPQFPKATIINYLLETSPKNMHLYLNGSKRSSQVDDKSEDYAIIREIAGTTASERYWVFDIEDIHCGICCKMMRDQRRRDYEKTSRWHSRARGALRHVHCMNSWCHGVCGHDSRSHHVLSRLGVDTTRKIKYIQLTSSEHMDPDVLASAITVIKPFINHLEGLEINLASSTSSSRFNHLGKSSRQESRRFICCFVELEGLLVEGARLKIRGLENMEELGNMWWDVRRKWWEVKGDGRGL
ncbi:5275ede2-753c-4ad1-b383-d3a435a1e404 [Sclerotinia trifoliorum]|uniref:5275ede2-753c-4ad1-b383-d3a435a1e404 n=1 Tax=Sclerotinia trifoliorum TaxID=28548 RepID=A0A8H2VN72_9HELO|nr:5275ede2-753c-4ad1-b383-d3a435a1e404 [Sclerotinia trifoliorum]